MKIIPGEVDTKTLHRFLLGAVSPRPICFASTMDEQGISNLAPYSFFGVFGSNPPLLIFSPARRVRDNTVKDTLQNIEATKEVVVNVVSYDIVQQMSLASCEYPKGVSEFQKAGFTPIESHMVKPFRVKESPAQLECVVEQVISTGNHGGAGNLIICKVVCMHVNDNVLDANGIINPQKIDLVARMGEDYYCRASGDAVFTVPKPNMDLGIGIDKLPDYIKNSTVLSGNDLGMLGNSTVIPTLDSQWDKENLDGLDSLSIQMIAKRYLILNQVGDAWQILLRDRGKI